MTEMRSTLQSGAVITFEVPDPLAGDTAAFPIGEWYQSIVGGGGGGVTVNVIVTPAPVSMWAMLHRPVAAS